MFTQHQAAYSNGQVGHEYHLGILYLLKSFMEYFELANATHIDFPFLNFLVSQNQQHVDNNKEFIVMTSCLEKY